MTSAASVLVVGGSGFLGRSVLRELKAAGIGPLGCAGRGGSLEPGLGGIELIPWDVRQPARLPEGRRYDWIVNCTGQITEPITACLEVCSAGLENLCALASAQRARLLHVSTLAVFGTAERVTEDSPLRPETPYGVCKAFAELTLARRLLPERFALLRLSNLFGDSQTKGIVRYLQRSLTTDRVLQFNHDGSLARYFLHVDDAAGVIRGLVERDVTGVFNLAGDERFSVVELVRAVEERTGVRFDARYVPARPHENLGFVGSERLERLLDVRRRRPLSEFLDASFGAERSRDG